MHSVGTWWLWIGFILSVLSLLAIDMLLLGRKESYRVSVKEAATWTLIWVACAIVFNILLWWYLSETSGADIAHQKALEFFTGYIIEESLSVDNMFVFLTIFGYFSVPQVLQRRVLLYGVLGAMVMRLIMILFGTWLVKELHWVLYLFGFFLVITGIKMVFIAHDKKDFSHNVVLNWLRHHLRVTETFHNDHFFIKKNALWYVTPLFLVLILIEISDLIFALDSIPAIFAITNDPFIIFSSNVFAILGLRALYFLLANMAARFYLLKYGIAIVLIFVGAKMLVEPWIQIPISIALSVVITLLGTTVILSLLTRKD